MIIKINSMRTMGLSFCQSPSKKQVCNNKDQKLSLENNKIISFLSNIMYPQ